MDLPALKAGQLPLKNLGETSPFDGQAEVEVDALPHHFDSAKALGVNAGARAGIELGRPREGRRGRRQRKRLHHVDGRSLAAVHFFDGVNILGRVRHLDDRRLQGMGFGVMHERLQIRNEPEA